MTPEQLFAKGAELLKSKADDYTSGQTDRYENFTRQKELISWFKNDVDKVFVALIAVKLARLGSLLDAKTPKHESIEDTFIDLINYCALWGGYRTTKQTSYIIPGMMIGIKGAEMAEKETIKNVKNRSTDR